MRFWGMIVWVLLSCGAARAEQSDVLAEWDIHVTGGAAAGYVPDQVCGNCHQDRYESFQDVGMAKSFYLPSADKVIEDFSDAHFYHAPSKMHYEMELKDGAYWFHRYQENDQGERIHQLDRKVDWILGSGNHSRVYLFRTDGGELFQLPLAWYTQDGGKWEMSPGYEFSDHLGETRGVQRQCMTCHNAFPEVPVGSDAPGMPEVFPADLPEGIGCQRCHGPGAKHVESVLSGEVELEQIRAAIVNPATLPNEQLYSICYGCHMQPSVAVTPELRLGRSIYSFRPGQLLDDYKVFLDIEDSKHKPDDRFDINHHPYRLEQSQCFVQSEGALGCLTCHDPHRKIAPENRAAHYREACLSCHETTQGLPVMATGTHPQIAPDADCTTCHMPERRTQDVIHAKMTDHRIQRDPGALEALTRPLDKIPPEVIGVSLLYPDRGLSKTEEMLAKTSAILRYSSYRADYAAEAMQGAMNRGGVFHYEPWLTLSKVYFKQMDYAKGLETAETGLTLAPDNWALRMQKALSLFGMGQKDKALAEIDALLAQHPVNATTGYNRGLFLSLMGREQEALAQLHAVLENADNHGAAWRLIARIEAAQGNANAAIDAYLKALQQEPRDGTAAKGLAEQMRAAGRADELRRYRVAE